jgi:tartrate dehydratase alpha subunit/fumarate hydratase class I-like protein
MIEIELRFKRFQSDDRAWAEKLEKTRSDSNEKLKERIAETKKKHPTGYSKPVSVAIVVNRGSTQAAYIAAALEDKED